MGGGRELNLRKENGAARVGERNIVCLRERSGGLVWIEKFLKRECFRIFAVNSGNVKLKAKVY